MKKRYEEALLQVIYGTDENILLNSEVEIGGADLFGEAEEERDDYESHGKEYPR